MVVLSTKYELTPLKPLVLPSAAILRLCFADHTQCDADPSEKFQGPCKTRHPETLLEAVSNRFSGIFLDCSQYAVKDTNQEFY